jgi:hypothetical protein
MGEADFSRIESGLGISLPAEYRRVMGADGQTLRELALAYRPQFDILDSVCLAPEHVVEHNRAERAAESETAQFYPDWWRTFMIVGTNGAGDFYCLRLDGRPGVWMIGSDAPGLDEPVAGSFSELVAERIRDYRQLMAEPERVVSVPCLWEEDWEELRRESPADPTLTDSYRGYVRAEAAQLDRHRQAGRRPELIRVPAGEYLHWCQATSRLPGADSRETFAAERLRIEQPWLRNARRG